MDPTFVMAIPTKGYLDTKTFEPDEVAKNPIFSLPDLVHIYIVDNYPPLAPQH